MSRKRSFMTAAVTFSVALSIGFVMQYGDAVASRFQPTQEPVMTLPQMVMPQQSAMATTLSVPEMVIPYADEAAITLAALVDVPVPAPMAPLAAPEPVCEVAMTADTLPLAMVAVSVVAPCQPNAAVTIHHQGMIFSQLTDETGRVDVVVPALAQEAFFIAAFAGGEGAVASTPVPDLANYDRAALQWQGIDAVQLHALEFGANYDSEGHVWAATSRDLDFAAPPKAGFLTTLGDDRVINALMAEVYTFPTGKYNQDGTVALSVEAEVTAANCGRDISAQSIQLDSLQQPTAIDLTMTMPDCGAIGEFLVLKNMFKDLTLAAK